jgi:hypothetical protein
MVSASSCLGRDAAVGGKGRDEWRVKALRARVSGRNKEYQQLFVLATASEQGDGY